MARGRTVFRRSQSMAGAVLVGLGMFVLYEKLAGDVAWLSQVLGAHGSETLGVLPAFVLAVSQGVQAYAADHQRFLQGLLQQMLISSWPVLLVSFGSVLSRDLVTEKSTPVQEDTGDPVDPASAGSRHKSRRD
jgi:hypothetical protein